MKDIPCLIGNMDTDVKREFEVDFNQIRNLEFIMKQ